MARYTPHAAPVASSVRPLTHKAFVVVLLTAAVALVMLGRSDHPYAKLVRGVVTDGLVPVLSVVSQPVEAAQKAMIGAKEWIAVHGENARLRAEITELQRLQTTVTELEAENKSLRNLLHYEPVEGASYTTAKVIGNSSGPYAKSLLINAGSDDGVKLHQAVINDHGLLGRVIELNARSARVLLLGDMNSRIPVVTQTSRERGIAGGDNSGYPALLYLSADTRVQAGERVVTTADGDIIPAGIPVGRVFIASDGAVRLQPLVDSARVEFVRVVSPATADKR